MPAFVRPDGAEFLWAVLIGLAAAPLGSAIRFLALKCLAIVERRLMLLTTAAGVVVAMLAVVYAQVTGMSTTDVLFSGEDSLPAFVQHHAAYSVGILTLLIVCKGLAYSISLGSFRGGPVFPSMFIGAAGGMLLSHLPGLPLTPAIAMGVGAMAAVMLRLPMTAVLLATLILGLPGIDAMPLVIVAVVVAFVVSEWLVPSPPPEEPPLSETAPTTDGLDTNSQSPA